MSGNPFRASLVLQNHPAAASPTNIPPADSSNRRDEGYAERDDDSGIGSMMLSTRLLVKGQRIMIAQCLMPRLRLRRQRKLSA